MTKLILPNNGRQQHCIGIKKHSDDWFRHQNIRHHVSRETGYNKDKEASKRMLHRMNFRI